MMRARRRVGLFGTMATDWRAQVTPTLRAAGCEVIDNTDSRWTDVKTTEQLTPLLSQDLVLMRQSDVVLWHHDKDTEGRTARIELGFLAGAGIPTVVHVEETVNSIPYIQSFTTLHSPFFRWASSLEQAVAMATQSPVVKQQRDWVLVILVAAIIVCGVLTLAGGVGPTQQTILSTCLLCLTLTTSLWWQTRRAPTRSVELAQLHALNESLRGEIQQLRAGELLLPKETNQTHPQATPSPAPLAEPLEPPSDVPQAPDLPYEAIPDPQPRLTSPTLGQPGLLDSLKDFKFDKTRPQKPIARRRTRAFSMLGKKVAALRPAAAAESEEEDNEIWD